MADVFISYAREDRACAESVANAIASKGLTVWWDRSIQVGRRFSEVIQEELDAARCVLVIWSKHSVSSDWVLSEAAEGTARRILIPIRIDDVRVPLQFRGLHTADIACPARAAFPELDECILAIEGLLGRKSGTEVAAVPAALDVAERHAPWIKWILIGVALFIAVALGVGLFRGLVPAPSAAVKQPVSHPIVVPPPPKPAPKPEIVDLDTAAGRISIELLPKGASDEAKQLKVLVSSGYYNGKSLHRAGPVIECCDLHGVGHVATRVKRERGYVSKAIGRSGLSIFVQPVPLGSQDFTVIGNVVAGMDVADKIARASGPVVIEHAALRTQ